MGGIQRFLILRQDQHKPDAIFAPSSGTSDHLMKFERAHDPRANGVPHAEIGHHHRADRDIKASCEGGRGEDE